MSLTHQLNLIRHSTPWLKFAEFRHRFSYQKAYYRMKAGMERYRACENKKPAALIRKEIRLAHKFWGCYPLFYYRHNLYRTDQHLSEEELLNFIPAFFFHRLLMAPYYNNKYRHLVDNKNISSWLYQGLAIPHAQTIAQLINGRAYDPGMKPIPLATLLDQINQTEAESIFIKPSDGIGGRDILKATQSDQGFRLPDGEQLSEKFFTGLMEKRNYIIQAGLQQAAALNEIYPDSINTFRIITENLSGQPRLVAALLRIGQSNSYVDNFTQGGIALGIDLASGQALEQGSFETAEKITHHPDTRYRFADFTVPNWPALASFVLECCQKLSFFPHLGWDIALTDKGPLVIEQNIDIGPDLPQMALGGLRLAYNIDDPMAYWRQSSKERVAELEKYTL
ncbi:MAG: hypothetical protein H0S79_24720 [Anaerolineaceae bacterium]|nr:hypothetical protein [Anaerolineaceae bacterium]